MRSKPRKAAGPRIRTAGKCNLFKKLKPRYFNQANISLVFRPGTPSQAKPSRQYAPKKSACPPALCTVGYDFARRGGCPAACAAARRALFFLLLGLPTEGAKFLPPLGLPAVPARLASTGPEGLPAVFPAVLLPGLPEGLPAGLAPRALRSTTAPSSRARSKGERGFSKRRDTFNALGLLPDFARGFGCAPRFCASLFCALSLGTESLAVACGVTRSSLPEEG